MTTSFHLHAEDGRRSRSVCHARTIVDTDRMNVASVSTGRRTKERKMAAEAAETVWDAYAPSAEHRVKRSLFRPCWMFREGKQTAPHSSLLRSFFFSSQLFWSAQQTLGWIYRSTQRSTAHAHKWHGLRMFLKRRISAKHHAGWILGM